MGGGDTDWDLYDIERRRAKKSWTCSECKRTIEPGERYDLHKGFYRYEGWSQWRKCAQCAQAIKWLNEVCDGYMHEAVAEDLAEHMHEGWPIRSLSLGRIVVSIKRGWRRRDGALTDVETVERWRETSLGPIREHLRREQERQRAEWERWRQQQGLPA